MNVSPTLTVVGSINVDITLRVDHLPVPGETILATERHVYLGGKGANQAVAAARLGAEVVLIGAHGSDDHGDFALAELAGAGVDVRSVTTSPLPTGTAQIAVDADGENEIIVYSGANNDVRLPAPGWETSDVLLCQLELDPSIIETAVDAARGLVVINAAPARHLPTRTLEKADLVVVNELEWAALPELTGCRRVIVTAGGDGASLFEYGNRVLQVPAVKTDVVSTVGAGDAYTAALAVAFGSGYAAGAAMRVASAVGAAAVARPESQPPLARLQEYA